MTPTIRIARAVANDFSTKLPRLTVPGSARDNPLVRLSGYPGDDLEVMIVVQHNGSVSLGNRGEHDVGNWTAMPSRGGEELHGSDDVLLGGRCHVQEAQLVQMRVI